MNRKFLFWSVVMACCAGSVLTSCSDDTVPENSTPDAPGIGAGTYVVAATVDGDRKSTRLNSSHNNQSRMPSSA